MRQKILIKQNPPKQKQMPQKNGFQGNNHNRASIFPTFYSTFNFKFLF